MGKKFAPNYANLFLAEWDEKALEKCVLKHSVYWRFLDDIFYDLGTLQGRLLNICENFEYPSPFDYCEGRVELGINAFLRHSDLQRKQI